MIKAEELRRGNYVKVRWVYVKVTSLNSEGIELTTEEVHCAGPSYNIVKPRFLFNHLEPIPLTPAILEKCGFEKEESLCGVGINDLIITYEDANISLMQDNKGDWMVSGMNMNHKHFKYLHQLQNLYYALTQTELTINL